MLHRIFRESAPQTMFYYEEESQVGDHNFYQPKPQAQGKVRLGYSTLQRQDGPLHYPAPATVSFEERIMAEKPIYHHPWPPGPPSTIRYEDPVEFYPVPTTHRPLGYHSLHRAKSLQRSRNRVHHPVASYPIPLVRGVNWGLDPCCLVRGQPIERRFSTLGHRKKPSPHIFHQLHHGTLKRKGSQKGTNPGVQKSYSLRQASPYGVRRFASDASEFLQQRVLFQGHSEARDHGQDEEVSKAGFARRFAPSREISVRICDGPLEAVGTRLNGYVGSLDRRGAIDKRSKIPKPPRSSKNQPSRHTIINLKGKDLRV